MNKWFLLLSLCLLSDLQAQQIMLRSQADAENRQIYTQVVLKNIPVQGRLRYQQRMPECVQLQEGRFKGLQWDTANNILTLIALQTIQIDSFSFDFTVNYQGTDSAVVWGESALMYETEDGSVRKITYDADILSVKSGENIPVAEDGNTFNIDEPASGNTGNNAIETGKDVYYIQISASKSKQAVESVKKTLPLQEGDKLCEMKDNKYYCYRIGPYKNQEEAKAKLKYYRAFVKDAFLVKK
ncbi:MAG: SPOR domain-containing protein [Bacteroidales bacterium]|nr:SPOR domain-containing protein [Bacteroidales bacterium]